MSPIRRFRAEDIGAELFPAITSGLYKEALDALREYIQNAVDAKAKRVDIRLTPDLVSVRDDGTGMTRQGAEEAIRLGISEKNPIDHVGFRGIGIYSSFDLCERLEIRTRPRAPGLPSIITVDFGAIRDMLADEDKRRKKGRAPSLDLQRMLTQAVTVDQDDSSPLSKRGTIVQMVGIRGDVFKKLNDIDQVTGYLQNVVPLRFNPEFRYAKTIGRRFKLEDYRVVDVRLVMNGQVLPVYRPYVDRMFTHEGQQEPKFFSVASPNSKTTYGFAWVCLNDARRALPERELRGLLIKKYGFSVSDRSYLEPFFGRTVFHRRITGEVIVQHDELIPNAARTNFENNPARADFQLALTQLVQDISQWADGIQTRLKALEDLDTIEPEVYTVVEEIPKARRDVERLLQLNIDLAGMGRQLKTHDPILKSEERQRYSRTLKTLAEAQRSIRELLQERRRQPAKTAAQRARARRREAPSEADTEHKRDRPVTLLEVLESLDVVVTEPVRVAVEYIDESILRPNLSEEAYARALDDLRQHLEESI